MNDRKKNAQKQFFNRVIAAALSCFLVLSPLWAPRFTFTRAQETSEGESSFNSQEAIVSPIPDEPSAQQPANTATVDNSANVTNNATQQATSGDNTITIDPSPTPNPSPLPDAAETDDQTETTDALPPTPTSTPDVLLQTGQAVSDTTVVNDVNTTSVNSQISNQTQNQSGTTSGTIEVSTPAGQPASGDASTETGAEDPSGSVTVNNMTELVNTIDVSSNTGENAIESASSAALLTGDAISLASVLNQVNTTLIDSILALFTVNIYGQHSGNIVLPEDLLNNSSSCCNNSVQVTNYASVHNTLTASSTTGGNTIQASDDATLETGNAATAINVVNLVNSTYIDSTILYLFINTFGSWNGSFLGWGPLAGSDGSNLLLTNLRPVDNQSCPDCFDTASAENTAHVTNVITASANTGNNNLTGTRVFMNTGNAFSAINLVNFVNTTLIGSTGYIGFINIFGELTGDIGGESMFPTTVAGFAPQQTSASTDDAPKEREKGGYLELQLSHNVGEYVLPGDTVTFFATIKNPGPGRVYETVLDISLIADGSNVGGLRLPIGTIKPFGTVKLSTGLVLANNAPAGLYGAVGRVSGVVGPTNDAVSATSEAEPFYIAGFSGLAPEPEEPQVVQQETHPMVMGTSLDRPTDANILKALLVLLLLIPSYVALRLSKEKQTFLQIFSRGAPLYARIRSLQVFLL